MPKISVIITTFNRATFLPKTIESVFNQTYTDLELILIDDRSTDNTQTIIKPWQSKIRYFHQRNKGTSAAKNKGIKEANGTYIAFLDSDDVWKKDKLEHQLNFMEAHPDMHISYTNEQWIRNGKTINIPERHQKHSGYVFKEALDNCFIGISTIMIKKELFNKIGTFDEKLSICEDYDLWLRILTTHPIYLLDQKLTIKQGGHNDQLSTCFWGMDRFRIIALKKILQSPNIHHIPNTPNIMPTIKRLIKEKSTILKNGALKRNRYLAAFAYWLDTIRYQ